MRSIVSRGLWVVCAIVTLAAAACAADAQIGFGGGGPGLGLYMPELTQVNAFLEDAGFPQLDGDLLLIGGSGRGGVVPGLTYGGAGWGAWIESDTGTRHADYGIGLGGFDLGYAVGGDAHSVLTLGAVMGGGGAEVVLTEHPVSSSDGWNPEGIIVEPTRQIYDSAFVFVAPYVDMQIRLLPWMGIGLRAGYLLPFLELNGQDDGPLDAPDLALPGTYVRLSVVFGGLADLQSEPLAEESDSL